MANFEFLATFDAFWAAHREMPEKSIDRSASFSQQYARQAGLQHSLLGNIASFSLFTSATLIFGLGPIIMSSILIHFLRNLKKRSACVSMGRGRKGVA